MMMNCVFQEGTVRAGGGGGVTIPTKSQPDDKIMSICTCTNNFHSSIPPSNVLLVIFAIGSTVLLVANFVLILVKYTA